MSTNTDIIRANYEAPTLIEEIEAALAAQGKPLNSLTLDDLAPVDEFHVRGVQATEEVIALLAPQAGMHILDAGSGLGGPARRIAAAGNCRVTGIDLSEDYCRAGNQLSQWVGLQDQVQLHCGDVTDMPRIAANSLGAAFTIHVAMNIENKLAFYEEIARVLKPGAAFLIYDIFSVDNQEIEFPVPWAKDEASSFLATVPATRQRLESTGFTVEQEIDQTEEGTVFINRVADVFSKSQTGAPPNLRLLTGKHTAEKFRNLADNFNSGCICLAMLLCRKPNQ